MHKGAKQGGAPPIEPPLRPFPIRYGEIGVKPIPREIFRIVWGKKPCTASMWYRQKPESFRPPRWLSCLRGRMCLGAGVHRLCERAPALCVLIFGSFGPASMRCEAKLQAGAIFQCKLVEQIRTRRIQAHNPRMTTIAAHTFNDFFQSANR